MRALPTAQHAACQHAAHLAYERVARMDAAEQAEKAACDARNGIAKRVAGAAPPWLWLGSRQVFPVR
jgi:hypothetical protein